MKKTGLGRGMGALFGDSTPTVSQTEAQDKSGILTVDIRKVEPNPTQPRQFFDESAIEELAESMKTFGIIQPLLVTDEGGHYTIIAGERRYRAARIAQIAEVPVIVKDYTEMEVLQVALIENIQRQDLTSIEEANCYKRLMEDFFFSADDIAGKLGKNKHAVISALHLLELSPNVQELASEGKITASHAKVLLAVEDAQLQEICAQKIIEQGLGVRGAEAMVKLALKMAAKKTTQEKPNTEQAENVTQAYRKAEQDLKQVLG